MNRKLAFLWKLLVGAYLIFVGVTLLRTFLNERPGNLELMCGIAAVFILVGTGYMIGLLAGAWKRRAPAKAAEYMEEPDMAVRPVRDRSVFRTAPMPVIVNVGKQDPVAEEEGTTEAKPKAKASPDRAATVQLQKVGPE